ARGLRKARNSRSVPSLPWRPPFLLWPEGPDEYPEPPDEAGHLPGRSLRPGSGHAAAYPRVNHISKEGDGRYGRRRPMKRPRGAKVLLTGAPGCGKTTLVVEIAR